MSLLEELYPFPAAGACDAASGLATAARIGAADDATRHEQGHVVHETIESQEGSPSVANDPSATERTSYLPADRTTPAILASEIERAAASPVADALLHASGAALAVVNRNHQLIAFNSSDLGLMPGLDGRATAEALRGRHPEMGVLYVSGHTEEVISKRGVL